MLVSWRVNCNSAVLCFVDFQGWMFFLFFRKVQEASNRTMALEAEVKREADFNASLEEMKGLEVGEGTK